jgi:hypothetical protein
MSILYQLNLIRAPTRAYRDYKITVSVQLIAPPHPIQNKCFSMLWKKYGKVHFLPTEFAIFTYGKKGSLIIHSEEGFS